MNPQLLKLSTLFPSESTCIYAKLFCVILLIFAESSPAVNPRPALTLQKAADLTLKLYGVMVTEITSLPSYIDQNFLVVDKEGTKYVLKILNSEQSKNSTLVGVQTFAMSFLRQHGVPAQKTVSTTTGQLMSMEEIGNSQGFCMDTAMVQHDW